MNTMIFLQQGIGSHEVIYPMLYKYLQEIQILISKIKRKPRTKRRKLKRKDSK